MIKTQEISGKIVCDEDIISGTIIFEDIIKDLKFGPGNGNLQYYLYNWRCEEMVPEQIGMVFL